MDFLKYIHYPRFRGVITRRTTPQLKGAGGIIDTSLDLFKRVVGEKGVTYKIQDAKFVFKSGAEIHLRHFENLKAKDNFQGLQANEILVDEGQQYEEEMVLYLMSRLRNPSCPEVKPRMRLTCNPLKDSYLHHWIAWYLDEEGYPIPERDGKVRYFIRKDNTMIWGDSAQELIDEYKTTLFNPQPLSFQFISATVHDNPVLMKVNPEYVAWLEGLKDVERARLLLGCWMAQEKSSGYWKREWCQFVDLPPLHAVKRVRAWDLSGTLPSDTNPNPDWTVGSLCSRDKFGNTYIEDVVRFRARFGEVFEKIVEIAQSDGDDVLISIPQDPGVAGRAYASTLIRDLADLGFYAKAKPTNKSKLTRFAPFAAASEAGTVKIVKGEWNDQMINELEDFDGGKSRAGGKKDDVVDTLSDAYVLLATQVNIPTFSVPDLSKKNEFAF